VRLDSGDLTADSRWVRERLDRVGWKDVQVFASGDLNEDRIALLLQQGACIDAFGVGTSLVTSSDAPALGVIYKLVEIERRGEVRSAAKFSEAKITYPGRKQVFRVCDAAGNFERDIIALEDEAPQPGEPLLAPVMRSGKRIQPPVPIARSRELCVTGLARLPASLRRIDLAAAFPLSHSGRLEFLTVQLRERLLRNSS